MVQGSGQGALKSIVRDGVAPGVAAFAFLLVTGYVSVWAQSVERGIVLDWGLEMEAIAQPRTPAWQLATVAIVAALFLTVFMTQWASARGSSSIAQRAVTLAVVLGVLGSIVTWSLMTATYPAELMMTNGEGVLVTSLRHGGMSPSTHVVAAALIVIVVGLRWSAGRRPDRTAGQEPVRRAEE